MADLGNKEPHQRSDDPEPESKPLAKESIKNLNRNTKTRSQE